MIQNSEAAVIEMIETMVSQCNGLIGFWKDVLRKVGKPVPWLSGLAELSLFTKFVKHLIDFKIKFSSLKSTSTFKQLSSFLRPNDC